MKKVIIILVIITIITGWFFVLNQQDNQKDTGQNESSRIDNQASVTVTVTPVDISPESKEWKFAVVMDTHSTELDQDLTKTSVLVDDQGTEYKPLRWDGAVGGHHREGVLMFNQITPIPKTVELRISGVGNVMRSFIWKFN